MLKHVKKADLGYPLSMPGAQAADVLQASVAQHAFCNSKMVRVCVRNTFISFDFGEDGDGSSAALELL